MVTLKPRTERVPALCTACRDVKAEAVWAFGARDDAMTEVFLCKDCLAQASEQIQRFQKRQ